MLQPIHPLSDLIDMHSNSVTGFQCIVDFSRVVPRIICSPALQISSTPSFTGTKTLLTQPGDRMLLLKYLVVSCKVK